MTGWTALTLAVVENALPTDMATLYASWVGANPLKAGRLAELVAEALATFRSAVASNPAGEVDTDPDTVPVSGFRHALNHVIFNLGMEMGIEFAPDVFQLQTRADLWLRMVQDGAITPAGAAGGGGTPSYAAPDSGGELECEGGRILWLG
jgi:hypothetical protein